MSVLFNEQYRDIGAKVLKDLGMTDEEIREKQARYAAIEKEYSEEAEGSLYAPMSHGKRMREACDRVYGRELRQYAEGLRRLLNLLEAETNLSEFDSYLPTASVKMFYVKKLREFFKEFKRQFKTTKDEKEASNG